MLKIVTVPAPILNKVAQPIGPIDVKIKKLVSEMEETLVAQTDPQGVGLAAPQIGESLRLFIIKPTADSVVEVFINPVIVETVKLKSKKPGTKSSKSKKNKLEGCLSIPRIWSPVNRIKKIFLEYQDLNGKKIKKWFTGFEAIIVQHEVDHLDGILFTRRSLEQNIPVYEEDGDKLKKVSI